MKDWLGLSYKNAAGVHKCVNSIPHRAGKWFSKNITFLDYPNEHFVLRHRNVLDTVKSLWEDPELAPHIVYKPKHIFRPNPDNPRNPTRVYNEMWAGKWWWSIQVL